jgi:hypothetical protein
MQPKRIDVYQSGLIKGNPYEKAKKREVRGKIVVVLDLKLDKRGYKLIPTPSRVVLSREIHELISTDEEKARPGKEVNRMAVIGFAEFTTGGVLALGDKVTIGGREIGAVVGFDETHTPNHLNIIILTTKRDSGLDLGIELEDDVIFSR